MDLKERKYLKNNPNALLKFEDGLVPADLPQMDARGNAIPIASNYLNFHNPVKIQAKSPDSDKEFKIDSSISNTSNNIANNAGGILSSGISFVGSLADTAKNYKTADQFIAEAKRSQSSINGVGYEVVSNAKDGKMPKYADGMIGNVGTGAGFGASVGSIFGPIGGAIGAVGGGLFGGILGGIFGNSAKKKEEEQRQIANFRIGAGNEYRRAVANTTAMQNDEQSLIGNQNNQSLYKDGKTPKYTNGKMVYSPFGPIGTDVKPDSMVSAGETVGTVDQNGIITNLYKMPGKKNNDDKIPFVGGKDSNTFIVTNKKGYSDLATVDPYLALSLQKKDKDAGILKKNKMGYASGKIGWLPNAIVSGLGSLAGLSQYFNAKNQTPYRPSTYYANPYANRALSTLAGLRMNELPIINQLRDAEARGNYALNNSGGLSGAQRYLGRIANVRNTQNSIAQSLAALQQQNNAYRSQYANALLQSGANEATNLMTARRVDDDVYMKSHAARLQGMNMGVYNMLNNMQQYAANEFKRRQFNNMYDLYAADTDLKKQALKKGLNWS